MDIGEKVIIRTYTPADIDYIIHKHQEVYEAEYGFGRNLFGCYVEKYIRQFEITHDQQTENIWIAEINNQPVGMIALVRFDETTAQLRWFLIEPQARGHKIGHALMKTLLDFAQAKQYKQIFLWTINILEAARYLYKYYGFTLVEIKNSCDWGVEVQEERWDLLLTP